ncbi:hypothetical protein LTS08_003877 [Lithohypha guttulata]|nr:hypothetical protein LTS08_003877 [Lithohypha guttulata]
MDDSETRSNAASDPSSEDSAPESEPELMITTRERRKTAGNRYSQVVAQEQADEDEEDDVALLFADAEGEDEEYNSDEADDEADMSPSDDDDQGPNAAPDDMDGETELQKQAKIERQKKRKADMAMTTMSAIRKKPKIDPTSLHRAPDKPKASKRKERVSWLPDQNAASGRTSLRKQTVAHREVMLERLKESEEQRLKYKAQREEKEKIKQAEAPKEMTQADRLAEAEKNEKRNARSLNRWETMEKQRLEEQAAKLAALKGRTLQGPVITLHSSRHQYQGPKIERTSPVSGGIDDGQPKKRGPKPKNLLQQTTALPSSLSAIAPSSFIVTTGNPALQSGTTTKNPAQAAPDMWLAGIHEYARQSGPGETTNLDLHGNANPGDYRVAQSQSVTLEEQVPSTKPVPAILPSTQVRTIVPSQPNSNISINPTSLVAEQIASMPPADHPLPPDAQVATAAVRSDDTQRPQGHSTLAEPASRTILVEPGGEPTLPQPSLIEVTSTRNLVVLEGFEDLTAEARQAFNMFYTSKKSARPVKHVAELCAITGLPARYRDPKSSAVYANATSFQKLRELQRHNYQWSSMLGCYVGRAGQVAKGVPDSFLAPVLSIRALQTPDLHVLAIK